MIDAKQSIFTGLIFGALNLWLLSRVVFGLIQSEKVKLWKTMALFLLKMTLVFVTIGLILKKGYVSPLPFLGGFSVSLVVGIGILLLRNKGRKQNHA